ncbi:hypothetical protein [Bythopirellula polymerisocia]|uniref:hypothetical protein n=1 Tax=Bythopirellula polymerisocia TaxID=2528003 RepID=UPI0011B367C5|nr:hypothetical protein [Bythopirellula polymerisocia]
MTDRVGTRHAPAHAAASESIADEAGISRLWGGIHVPPDDFAGRIMGSAIGIGAYQFANQHFGVIPEPASGVLLLLASSLILAGRPGKKRKSGTSK